MCALTGDIKTYWVQGDGQESRYPGTTEKHNFGVRGKKKLILCAKTRGCVCRRKNVNEERVTRCGTGAGIKTRAEDTVSREGSLTMVKSWGRTFTDRKPQSWQETHGEEGCLRRVPIRNRTGITGEIGWTEIEII